MIIRQRARDARVREALIVSAYEAGSGQSNWTAFASQVARDLSASVVAVFAQELDNSKASFLGQVGITATAQREYEQYYSSRNVLMILGRALHAPGVARTTEMICSPPRLLGSEYYNDFLRPHDARYSAAITTRPVPELPVHLSVFRPHGASPFGQPELQLLRDLYPHLTRALQLQHRLARADRLACSFEDAFEGLGKAVAFVDGAGKVVHLTDAFARLVRAGDGLMLTRHGLCATGEAGPALQTVIANAIGGGTGGAVSVTRPSGEPGYSVLVGPILRRLDFLGPSRPAAFVVVSDPKADAIPSVIRLQQIFGLTRTEARIAARLASGAPLRGIADQLQMSIHTARTHLKRIFSKTGTHRQAELVRRLIDGRI